MAHSTKKTKKLVLKSIDNVTIFTQCIIMKIFVSGNERGCL